jgi:DNA-binding NtrC family response regulator
LGIGIGIGSWRAVEVKSPGAILLAGGDPSLRSAARDALKARDLDVLEAQDVAAAEAIARNRALEAIVLAEPLPRTEASAILGRLHALEETIPVVVLASDGTTRQAGEGVAAGGAHRLTAAELPELPIMVERLIEQARQRRREAARAGIATEPAPFLGESAAVRRLEAEARNALRSGRHILIEGESGVGKRALARWLYRHGPRADEAFVECHGARASGAELFGERADTVADARKGLLELAHRGTLFVGEIADLDPDAQARLLVAIEERRVEWPGGAGDRFVDVQLLAGTRRDLVAWVREGRFRADLYERIAGIALSIPPLRERPEDIPSIAATLLAELRSEFGRPHASLSFEACAALSAYPWPNNLRELRNVLEWGLLCADQNEIAGQHLGLEVTPPATSDLSLTLSQVEQRHIERVLESEGGHVERAAKRLDVPRSTLYQRIKALGIRPRFRG